MARDHDVSDTRTHGETDERFPGGPWKGFFLQEWSDRSSPRHAMRLALDFAEGHIHGDGEDSVGEFLIDGNYETTSGRCTFVKQYVGTHSILYKGWAETRRGIWGVWELAEKDRPAPRGGFHIWPRGMHGASDDTLEAQVDTPVSSLKVAGQKPLPVPDCRRHRETVAAMQ